MSRPEYVKCIKRPMATDTTSWCDRNISMEFAFTGIDHAAATILNHDRLLPCPECVEAIERTIAPFASSTVSEVNKLLGLA